jgi:hypothetical protein
MVDAAWPYSLERRLLQPYINAQHGAFEPVAFVKDNATLPAGRTTFGFRNLERIGWFAPAGEGSNDPYSNGLQWVATTAWPGVKRLYWNQTRFETNLKDRVFYMSDLLLCFSLGDSKYVDDLGPVLGTS